jgi:hypothetical protein
MGENLWNERGDGEKSGSPSDKRKKEKRRANFRKSPPLIGEKLCGN